MSEILITRRAVFTGVAAQTVRVRRKPNFLFLLADDHAGYVLGCDGNPLALTPNIDRLASEGTRFSAHHCNSPVCTPSRQSFLTGQLPHSAGVTVLGTPLAADKPTLAKQFQRAASLRPLRRRYARHLHRAPRHPISRRESRQAIRAVDQLSGTEFAF